MISDRSARLAVWVEESLGDSPFYLRLGRAVVGDRSLVRLASEAPPGQPGLLPLFAAVQFLLLAGTDHRLANYYPSVGGVVRPDDRLVPAFIDFCRRRHDEIVQILRTRLVRTNEVARAAILMLALSVVAARTGHPLAVIEIGASAGLLLRWDRYRHVFGSAGSVGDATSPVRINCEPRGPTPPPVPSEMPEATWRCGIDLAPVDLRDPLAARWLEALVWPDQDDRRVRLRAAIEVARSNPVDLVAGDAVTELPALIARAPDSAALCLVHSMVLNQFSAESRQELDRLLQETGRPVWRVSMEWIGTAKPVLSLTGYDGGGRSVTDLADYHHHGDWIAWR